jgi:hypothetical protein
MTFHNNFPLCALPPPYFAAAASITVLTPPNYGRQTLQYAASTFVLSNTVVIAATAFVVPITVVITAAAAT